MKIGRTLAVSAEIVLGHWLRATLSSFAIFVGVFAFVVMIGTSEAARQGLLAQVRSMGTDVLVVQSALFQPVGDRRIQSSSFTTLMPRDSQLIVRDVPGVRMAAGITSGSRIVSYLGNRLYAPVVAVAPQYFAIKDLHLTRGRRFTAGENRGNARLAILGSQLASGLFGHQGPIGKPIRIGGIPFKVIGTYSTDNRSERRDIGDGMSAAPGDQGLIVPLRTGMLRVLGVSYLDSICVRVAPHASLQQVTGDIAAILRRSHRLPQGKSNDFTIEDPLKLLREKQGTNRTFRVLTGSVAAISLFAGCAGILAVMLLTVGERVTEIGLRRALGARRLDVGFQFLLESAILAACGGFPGASVGVFGNLVACHVVGWPLVWPWQAAAGAFVFSLFMGVICGLAPALLAARLVPAESLRGAI